MSKTRAVIYCRVSSKEQENEGYSLPAQEKFLKEYAQREENDYKIAEVFQMSESAGGKVTRKIFQEMMEYIHKHDISVVIVETTDRLTRNFADVPVIDAWILANEEHQIHLAKEGCILHKNSKSHEWFMWRVKVATAEYYVKLLSENVQKGQKEKIAQGWLPTKPPLGYKTIGEKGRKIHVVDEEKAPLVKRMFELYATGNYSVKALTALMNKEGLRNIKGGKVVKSRVHELLSDPFYYGKMRWKGEIHDANHDHLISKDMFDAVQAKLARKTASPSYRKHLPVFKAMIECEECRGLITWETQKGHWYGHCNHYRDCSQKKYIRQEKVEKQLFPYFDKVAPIHREVLDVLEQALEESQSDEIEYNESKRDTLNRIVIAADKRMEAAYRDKLDGAVPLEICQKAIDDSIKEKEDALEALKKLHDDRAAYYEAGLAVHELALQAFKIYHSKKATTEDKRLLLSHMFEKHTMSEAVIQSNYTFAFDFLAEWMPKVNAEVAKQNTPEAVASGDALLTAPVNRAMELPESRKHFRTSKKSPVKPRLGQTVSNSRPLLLG